MSDHLFDPVPALLARKAVLEAEAVEIQARVIENRARHEEVCAMLEQIERKGRRKPGPQPGTPRQPRLVEPIGPGIPGMTGMIGATHGIYPPAPDEPA